MQFDSFLINEMFKTPLPMKSDELIASNKYSQTCSPRDQDDAYINGGLADTGSSEDELSLDLNIPIVELSFKTTLNDNEDIDYKRYPSRNNRIQLMCNHNQIKGKCIKCDGMELCPHRGARLDCIKCSAKPVKVKTNQNTIDTNISNSSTNLTNSLPRKELCNDLPKANLTTSQILLLLRSVCPSES
ncbi:MAG TPA: hypothetical protein VJ201_00310, partial [Candidatus Babeliales bacterium]|nr:hypothetical protein [Candidatus Babeliales bacterium]